MLLFGELINEVKRRALRDQSGTEFDTAVKNAINSSLFRISRECPWRVMRRKTYFDTVPSYTSTTNASVSNSSTCVTLTGATLHTEKIEIGRKIGFGTDSGYYTIRAIHTNSGLVIDRLYEGTTSTSTTYEIYPQEEYTIPMQTGHRMFLWHEDYGYPYKLEFLTDQDFFYSSAYRTTKGIPTHYRMWGEDNVITQVPSATKLAVMSSTSSDTKTNIVIIGEIDGYPANETIALDSSDATDSATGASIFNKVERVMATSPTNGYVTVKSQLGDYTISVIPQGDTGSIMRKKVQLYPLPTRVFPINAYYYKDPLPLYNDDDIHEMGHDFDEAIILLATAKLKYQDDQKEGDRFYGMYKDEMRSLRKTNMDKIDWFPILGRSFSRRDAIRPILRYGQIGPNYGPSTRL